MNIEDQNGQNKLNTSTYDDSSIQVLEGLEPIRKRPGMYIGSVGIEGLHHLIWEALDNAVDEVTAGYASQIKLTLEENHIVSVEDNGRGIPIGINSQTGLSNVVTIFTYLHAGGKFDNSSYKTSGGLHGVGIKCVNALSTFLEVNICREGKEIYTKFSNGGKVETEPSTIREGVTQTGTKIRWQPDFTVLDPNSYDLELIKERIKNLSFLNKNISFYLEDKRTGENIEFLSEQGLTDWIGEINQGTEVVHPIQNIFIDEKKIQRKGKTKIMKCEISFQYVSNRNSSIIHCFCNNIKTPLGGTHLEAVKEGILSCVREAAVEQRMIKNQYELIKDDIVAGISLVISLYYEEPSYKGQTKDSLISNEIKPILKEEVHQWLHKSFEEDVDSSKLLLEHIKREYLRRLHREEFNEMSKNVQQENLLGFAEKLADCTIKDRACSELYIVEGDSAGGSAKGARNREFQAILPIKGKLANASKNTKKILKNEEVANLINAIGCSYGSAFDIESLKYNKIILMTDADVDGSHIQVLILNFFYQYMKNLLESGHVYLARPPLYKASSRKETVYLFTDEEKEEFNNTKNKNRSFEISRFKGLGEMSPSQLWETTMDPKTRTLSQIKIEDDEEAQKTMEKLMGKKVKPRRKFIEDNYDKAMLDI
ncbi:DNA gyrase/topoisomerase IV subunit B [Mycoplasma parvum]|uniref:DNA topoisomerase (ATP-hydrolyzing) n=1 Tax=Mycoplasma parvum str. Indiana TaxID=1403316 RepID=U5NB64_9MOLU|nr:type IIA DNA topoisomerase subunit B [Mycoplasma parvum]AGX88816.1 hypothetical protein PRV_00155 [Mycoplasma parvum str. Indiana]